MIGRATSGAWERRVHIEHVWGTVVTFDLRADEFPDDYEDLIRDCVDFMADVDRLFSTYRVDSTITMVRNGLLSLESAPAPVREVLAGCATARDLSHGFFDPWAVPGGVDPSGYVKGWAAGKLADRLVAAGLVNAAVNASGDIACRGLQAPGEPWSIGILNPQDTQQVAKVVHLSDTAIATSGLYERGAHILNPRTGRTETWYESATVIGPDSGLADALATACLIAGPTCAEWFAALPAWSVYLIRDGAASYFGPAFTAA